MPAMIDLVRYSSIDDSFVMCATNADIQMTIHTGLGSVELSFSWLVDTLNRRILGE